MIGLHPCRLLRVDLEKPRAAFQVRRQAEPLKPRLSALEQPKNSSLSLLQELKGLVLSLKTTQGREDTAQGRPSRSANMCDNTFVHMKPANCMQHC